MSMVEPFLSVIIPAYNEENRLPATLRDLDGYLSARNFRYEIIVVNDGSGDGTAAVVQKLSSQIANLRLLSNTANRGKGAVIRQGMLAAEGTWRLFMDADNSTSIKELDKLMPCLRSGYDVAIGSRAVKGAKLLPPQPFYKRVLSYFGNLFIQLLLTPGIRDTQCGFKCYSRAAAQKVFRLTRINSWGFDAEALALAQAFGYRIREIPVFWANDIRTHVRGADYFQVLFDTAKVRWRLWRNAYRIESPDEI